ncbi:MAG: hypothetical protein HC836_14605 [Richelia sp. RM2_1_2]|nr:hypothetical protein [Richelia sp. SM2_1_7]NJM18828.1 hypothetical protein [Richelia sp. SM1_7_0]NJN07723.1 hypothetical protein [Richelia sp. RM1_1_1]NJO27326.1 hypothetical protein [Richelia sp. SL_2_1]NJO59481.1 hypothetical protein [Richelia sp. RM2_1_2]NJS17042.1 hypothetical protein [Nostocaceae cyanobacterium CSU_2_110]
MSKGLLPLICFGLIVVGLQVLNIQPGYSQTATSNQTSNVGNDASFNQILQSNPQLPVTNTNNNSNNFNYPNIYPLNYVPNAHVNTENDFGFNLSAGVNTLDASNVTVYLGFIFQPGRTEDHKLRMSRLRKKTKVLETQKKIMEGNLTLLHLQIEEASIGLERLQKSSDTSTNNQQ